jgi:hypothetical protein
MMDFIVARSIIQRYENEDKFNTELKGNHLHDKQKVVSPTLDKVSPTRDKVSPTRDKVCSQCGQQYHWCVCYLNEYQ